MRTVLADDDTHAALLEAYADEYAKHRAERLACRSERARLGEARIRAFGELRRAWFAILDGQAKGTSTKEVRRYDSSEGAAGASVWVQRLRIPVLVVDDDPDLLTIAATIMSELGYLTLAATSGLKALEILRDTPAIVLLMTDLVMPGMDGFELVENARAVRPGLKILYTSSHVPGARGNPALRYGPFIAKPWRHDELRHQLIELLGTEKDLKPHARVDLW